MEAIFELCLFMIPRMPVLRAFSSAACLLMRGSGLSCGPLMPKRLLASGAFWLPILPESPACALPSSPRGSGRLAVSQSGICSSTGGMATDGKKFLSQVSDCSDKDRVSGGTAKSASKNRPNTMAAAAVYLCSAQRRLNQCRGTCSAFAVRPSTNTTCPQSTRAWLCGGKVKLPPRPRR